MMTRHSLDTATGIGPWTRRAASAPSCTAPSTKSRTTSLPIYSPRRRPVGSTSEPTRKCPTRLAEQLKDPNYRIFAARGAIHVASAGLLASDQDPFALFRRLLANRQRPIEPGHAFYLGYEMAKAATALTLGKEYRQDEALDWGLLSVPEPQHHPRDTGVGEDDTT